LDNPVELYIHLFHYRTTAQTTEITKKIHYNGRICPSNESAFVIDRHQTQTNNIIGLQ